ncbi:carboxypeptidase-like regulatory domain-containing protein [Pedobacter sandarakinus]|uniref:carboxypeptidase-like regulatory domain-containing protein n=1 Tax=Pedobacter sandarakinus TaxID=353156 RepID=UPI002247F90B|nr:carboxypeptidase-like regulatory domain-containing protein [Pedobacter sandarakinus]MCX2575599.1 carboxypeptidase-like regulatory domain-containing protein [Pedobacter sandarakinus]
MFWRIGLFILVFAGLVTFKINAQTTSISGIIKDKKGEVLPGAGIYVSGYKMATVADEDGKFSLRLNPGNYDLLIQLIGFNPQTRNVLVADKPIKIEIVLEESIIQLAEVTIKPDPNRQYYVNLFREFFIGTTPNAKQCKMINPQVLDIDYDKVNKKLTVKTNEFLIIENEALGYRIKYLVKLFEWDSKTNIIYYEGFPTYEELTGSERKKKIWRKKRQVAYLGSPQHFFSSLYRNTLTAEGFIVNKLVNKPNINRPADSTIEANIKKLTQKQLSSTGRISIGMNDDSLSFWINQKRQPKNMSILNRATVLQDTLVKTINKSIKSINFTDNLYIIYTKENEAREYANLLNASLSRPLDMGDFEISLITLQIAPVYFYENGGIYDPRSMLFSGYWAWEKIADSVPMDYTPSEPE